MSQSNYLNDKINSLANQNGNINKKLINGLNIINNKCDDLLPIGSVIYFAASSVPSGYLICNGAAISRTTYSDLFTVISTTYGTGDGSTTFNLPNLVNKFIEGASSGIGGSINAGLPNATGTIVGRPNEASNEWSGPVAGAWGGAFTHTMRNTSNNYSSVICTGTQRPADTVVFDLSGANSIYGNSSTVQPPAIKLLPCIKYITALLNNN